MRLLSPRLGRGIESSDDADKDDLTRVSSALCDYGAGIAAC